MIRSPWDIDKELGLAWYSVNSPGTGGVLRSTPDDFQVEEIGDYDPGTGPYLICKMQKINWDQHRAIKAIASGLAISHQRIGFAGTKDKRAVTTQNISIYRITCDKINSLHIPDISLQPLGYAQHQIKLGDLSGNRFFIRIRDVIENDIPDVMSLVSEKVKDGIPNYVGYQRFGVTRPVTHLIGLEILKGNYQEAIRVMIGKPGTMMDNYEKEGRNHYYETENAEETLHLFPIRLSLERSVLHFLVNNPGNYLGAISSLPRTLRSMYVSAFQSWLFNHTLSMRINEGRDLNVPDIGDRLIWPDGRTDVVSTGTVHAADVQIKHNRCGIALLLPGGKFIPGNGKDDQNCAALLEENGVNPEMFSTVSSIFNTAFSGSFRPVMMKTRLTYEKNGSCLLIYFDLPPGQYATSVLREIMKTNPLSMI